MKSVCLEYLLAQKDNLHIPLGVLWLVITFVMAARLVRAVCQHLSANARRPRTK